MFFETEENRRTPAILSRVVPIRRNSYDNELSSHGRRLLDICRSADLRILNGRVSCDTLSRATFHGRNRISQSSIMQYVTKILFQMLQIFWSSSHALYRITVQ